MAICKVKNCFVDTGFEWWRCVLVAAAGGGVAVMSMCRLNVTLLPPQLDDSTIECGRVAVERDAAVARWRDAVREVWRARTQ